MEKQQAIENGHKTAKHTRAKTLLTFVGTCVKADKNKFGSQLQFGRGLSEKNGQLLADEAVQIGVKDPAAANEFTPDKKYKITIEPL